MQTEIPMFVLTLLKILEARKTADRNTFKFALGAMTPKGLSRPAQKKEKIPDAADPVSAVLLRHVNFRISSYFKSAYPDATWEWREEFPERIVSKGGTGRIQVFGIPDFNYADVTFSQQADINCSLLKIVPLSQMQGQPEPPKAQPQNKVPVDPQIWYEKQGRTVLENLIADLSGKDVTVYSFQCEEPIYKRGCREIDSSK